MDLYEHIFVIHIASFYEKMDFKNASVKRKEGYLAYMKKILLKLTLYNIYHD